MWSIYLVQDSGSNRTYIGATNRLEHRLRTHRLKHAAAAKATKSFSGTAQPVAAITNIPSKRLALSMEWHAKRRRQRPRKAAFLSVLDLPKFKGISNVVTVLHHQL
jgi:predicted GIY-YIG superfamily endonuclease